MRIKKLPQSTINQIAAGEVVEAPAHLLKELLENSIDAGAKSIEIDFTKGGKEITVKDDGHGISQEELSLVLFKHTTSKIQTINDLWKLKSFGFRGEALASAASISKLSITTCTDNSKAHTVTSSFGKMGQILPTHASQGTIVKIKDLFANCPARLKFLKSEGAESMQIKKTIKALAMIHPQIAFKVLQNRHLLYYFPSTRCFHQRVKTVLSDKDLYYLHGTHLHFQCEIVFSRPHAKQKNSQNIWLFVQRRWVQDLKLKMAVIESYRNLLMHGTYPTSVVNLTCDPAEIDVNIHPAKSQVKFKEPADAFRAVARPLRMHLEKAPWLDDLLDKKDNGKEIAVFHNTKLGQHTLSNHNFTPSNLPLTSRSSTFKTQYIKPKTHLENGSVKLNRESISQAFDVVNFPKKNSFSSLLSNPNNTYQNGSPAQLEEHQIEPKWQNLEVLGQCNLTYIVAQSRKGLILIDQHAAHERVVFERLMNSWNKKEFKLQKNLIPQTLKLESHLCDHLLKHNFNEIGIEIERIGPDTLVISSKPAILSDESLKHALLEAARQIEELGDSFSLHKIVSHLFATMACHSAIRAGKVLSLEEMKSLLEQMDEFKLSSFCPHGRPVFTEFSFLKLDKEFGRIT